MTTLQNQNLDEALLAFHKELPDDLNAAQARRLLAEQGIIFFCTPVIEEEGRITLTGKLIHVDSGDELKAEFPLFYDNDFPRSAQTLSDGLLHLLAGLPAARPAPQAQRPTTPATSASQASQATNAVRQARPTPKPGQGPMTPSQWQAIHGRFKTLGIIDADKQIGHISHATNKRITKAADMTAADASAVITHLDQLIKDEADRRAEAGRQAAQTPTHEPEPEDAA
ncbi:hypothetical protein EJ997_10165 [Flaviflexus ciconiae]|uniref:Uncharacterized protein n=1 Tax=Flaviflexus ciconiae TaxID=2496867 RepID=A0A3S9PZ57_9ACTO|nr:hypothetical protein [Flaviflexus ciconiae]AZQ77647.1 hypothetical protein EJ997_10165 [Flaviflexus ciconiae]